MRTTRRRFVVGGVVLLACVVAIAAAARAVAPVWIRGQIERIVGRTLGRDMKFAGAFDVSISMTPTLSADDVTLANAPWGSEPAMARIGRVKVALDLASLWAGPVTVRDVRMDDVRVLLEANDEGRGNWMFDLTRAQKPRTSTTPPRRIVIEQWTLRGLELTYRPRPEARPLAFGVADLTARLDPASRMVDVRGRGHFNDAPWDIAGRLGPFENLLAGRNLDQVLTGHIGQSSLSLSGHVDDPLTLGGLTVETDVEGPDIAAVLAVFGLRSPLTGPFRARTVIGPKDDEVGVEASAVVGSVTAQARGIVNAILKPVRIDATVEGSGPEASTVGSWMGVVGFPRRPFRVAGRIRRDGGRLSLSDTTLSVGGTSVTVGGSLGALPRCIGTDLQVSGSGTDLSELSALTRLRLPAGPYTVQGRFLRRADGLAIDGVEVQVRGSTVHAAGVIGEPPAVANLDLTADATGPDASWLSGIARIELPAEPFQVKGRVGWNGTTVALDGVDGRLGDTTFFADGRVATEPKLVGTAGRVRIAGRDLAKTAAFAELRGLPAQPFDAAGHLAIFGDRIELDDVDAQVGTLVARLGGRIGLPSPLDGTSLSVHARGSKLSDLAEWGVPGQLPPEPFGASGGLRFDQRILSLDDVTAEVASDRLTVDGTLGALPERRALDVTVAASGPRLADLTRFVPTVGDEASKRIPPEPYSFSGHVRRADAGLDLSDVNATVGNAKLTGDGTLAWDDRWLGTDLRFDFEAPDASIPSHLSGLEFPEGAVRVRGRLERTAEGVRFDDAKLTLGASYGEISGTLGAPPKLTGTRLDVSVEGPNLQAFLGPPTALDWLPSDGFGVTAHLHGGADALALERFTGHIGNSDLAGTVALRLEGRPFVDAALSAKHLDVTDLLAGFAREADTTEPAAAPEKKRTDKRDRVIPDTLLGLEPLRALDARVRLKASDVVLPGVPLRDVDVDVGVTDGALSVSRFEGTGQNGGRATASLSLAPYDGGYRLHADGRLDGGRLHLPDSADPAQEAPSLDIEFEVDGAGRSLHDIASTADGRVLLLLGPGRVANEELVGKASAKFIAFMDAINPLRKSTPYTAFECAVAAAGIEAGKTVVSPIAARTDKLTALGNGKIDFATEAIDLTWTIKPRRNVGISAGSIANPYIKLGGTLADPRLEAKPLQAAVSTGAAVATAGLTILFKGIYDRITAEKKVCVQALAKARKQEEQHEARKAAAPPE